MRTCQFSNRRFRDQSSTVDSGLSVKLRSLGLRQSPSAEGMALAMSLPQEHLDSIAIAGRVSSALSLLGTFAIIGTFFLSRFLRSPIHRIIFYAAFYNLVEAVATMISVNGPERGDPSSLCQFQAFVLQMFPLADVLWTFAMALDVYLVVFYHFDSGALKRLEIPYFVLITALTFIPALVFLFIRTSARGPIYGSAIIWCAISVNWTLLRLLIYFAPAWIMIAVIMLVYCLVGIKIWILHSDIRLASDDYSSLATSSTSSLPSNRTTSTANASTTATTTLNPKSLLESPRSPELPGSALQPPLEGFSIPGLPTPSQPRPPRQRRLSFRQYILIPLRFFSALLATWIAPTVYRVYLFAHADYMPYSLLLAVSVLGSLRGFFNAIIFLTMGIKGRRRRVSDRPEVTGADDTRLLSQ